jgi:hypothetical protein
MAGIIVHSALHKSSGVSKGRSNYSYVYYETNTKIQQLIPASTDLLNYCRNGNTNNALFILNTKNIEYLSYNIKDNLETSNCTAFIWACANRMIPVIERFIDISMEINTLGGYREKPFNLNEQNKFGGTALMYICINGLYQQLIKLITNKFPYYRDHRAYLDVNIQDNIGNTAMMFAMINGHINLVKALLNDPDANIYLKNNKGQTIYEITEEFHPEYLEEIHQIIQYKVNKNNLNNRKKNINTKKKKFNEESEKIGSSVFTTQKNNAKKNYKGSKQLLKNKIIKITSRIDGVPYNIYQIKIIKYINSIIINYNLEDIKDQFFIKYSKILAYNNNNLK